MSESECQIDKNNRNLEMNRVSGYERTLDPLVVFFYLLYRDMSPGLIEAKIRDALDSVDDAKEEDVDDPYVALTNGWLARYAKHTVERFTEEDRKQGVK